MEGELGGASGSLRSRTPFCNRWSPHAILDGLSLRNHVTRGQIGELLLLAGMAGRAGRIRIE
jgi:hypothetical protein